MVSYTINVDTTKALDFQQIMQSLKNVGVIISYQPTVDLTKVGKPVSTKTLLSVLDKSEQQIAEGKVYTMEEVEKIAQSWKKR